MHVIVIGGGIIGAACAVRLQLAGHRVTVIDAAADPRDRASFGNAALICPELVEPLSSWRVARRAPGQLFGLGGPLDFVARDIGLWGPWAVRYLAACSPARYPMGVRALGSLCADAAPAWRRLVADIGRPDLMSETPHWTVWESAASFAAGSVATLARDSAAKPRSLSADELAAVRRDVSSHIAGGVCLEGTAKITDSEAMVEALHRTVTAGGGCVVHDTASLIEAGARLVHTLAGSKLEADLVLVAAGAWSAPLVGPAGLTAPLVAERGYHLQFAEHALPPGAPPLVFEDRYICVVRAGGDVRVTGFTEVGRPGSPPDPRKWARLRRHVAELGLPVTGEPSRWMGARPTLPDFLPAIGRKGRLLYAFGHQHIGLTLAAVTAEAVVALAQGQAPPALEAFGLERFG